MVPTTPGFQVPPSHDATLLPRRFDDLARARRRGAGAVSHVRRARRPEVRHAERVAPRAARRRVAVRAGHAGSTGSDIGRPVRRRAPHAPQPRLRVGHRRRRQPQRIGRRVVPRRWRRTPGAPRCRWCGSAGNGSTGGASISTTPCRTASPAASSGSSPERSTSAASSSPIPTASTGSGP